MRLSFNPDLLPVKLEAIKAFLGIDPEKKDKDKFLIKLALVVQLSEQKIISTYQYCKANFF